MSKKFQKFKILPSVSSFRFPPVRPHPWNRVFRNRTPQSALSMISAILEFSPQKRVRPIIALQHEFFKELRDPNQRLPNGMPLPHKELFEFDLEEVDTRVVTDAGPLPADG